MAQAMRSRAFWILMVVLFLFSIGQNGAMTHLSALADGSRRLVGRRGDCGFADGRREPAGPAGDGLAAGPLLRATPGFLSCLRWARWGSSSSPSRAFAGDGLAGRDSGRVAQWAARPISLLTYLSRYFGLRSFSMLYGFTWTGYAIAGAIGPVLMGRAFDTTRILSGAGREALRPHALCGGAHAGDAGVCTPGVPGSPGARGGRGLAGFGCVRQMERIGDDEFTNAQASDGEAVDGCAFQMGFADGRSFR